MLTDRQISRLRGLRFLFGERLGHDLAPSRRLALRLSSGSVYDVSVKSTALMEDKYIADLLDDVILLGLTKGFLKILVLCELSLGDIDEDVGDLKYIIQVLLYSISPFLYFVLIACNLSTASLKYIYRATTMRIRTSNRFPPFLRRTMETLVSLLNHSSLLVTRNNVRQTDG